MFWILCRITDPCYGSFRRQTFNLDISFEASEFPVSLLRQEIAEFCRTHPNSVTLEQDCAVTRHDGTKVFVTEGIGWADGFGRIWREHQVGGFHIKQLHDDDILPFSNSLRWAINAHVEFVDRTSKRT